MWFDVHDAEIINRNVTFAMFFHYYYTIWKSDCNKKNTKVFFKRVHYLKVKKAENVKFDHIHLLIIS